MGKMRPPIHNKKMKKTLRNNHSSKKSKRNNNNSKRSSKKFNLFYSSSGYSSKKSSKKKYLENPSKRKKRKDEIIKNINIPDPTSISNNNYTSFNNHNFFSNESSPQKQKCNHDWMGKETENIEDAYVRFSKEIIEYVNYIVPNNKSASIRGTTVQYLKQVIKRKRPEWKVHLFGSFKQGTSTIFSDLDFEIIIDKTSSRKRDIDELFYLMKILRKNDFSDNIRLIKARVPILKATCNSTGINVDISVNRHNGYQAAEIIKKIISQNKILKYIIILVKILLIKRKLNEAHTGGMSSFLIFHLVFFFYNKYIKEKIYLIPKDDFEQSNINGTKNILKKMQNNVIFTDDSIESDDGEESKSDKVFTLTKANSMSDEEYNSNDCDSNIIHNGESSSNSDSDQKSDKKSEINDIEMGNQLKLQNSSNLSEYYSKNNEDNTEDKDDGKNVNKKEILDSFGGIDIVDFLLKLLIFYGKKFDSVNQGISINENGNYQTYFKAERFDMDCSDTISVESIQEPGIDIGKSCFKYREIQFIFFKTYCRIEEHLKNNTNSILQALDFPNDQYNFLKFN